MICPICRNTGADWKNVDQFRLKPEGMALCDICGFISYPKKYRSKSEIVAYYKKDYRAPPNASNVHTSIRKVQYHAHFLADVIKEWRAAGRKAVVTDVGSAFGYFLNWIRGELPGSEVCGVELTTSYVRAAWNRYQIKTTDEFDDSRQYDLVASYKSLEHILDPDVELRRYIKALKPDGFLYLSVPLWFEQMKNFGMNGFDLEYYYSPNHINTWTRKHFEGLIRVSGGEIVKQNDSYYEATYLVKRNDALVTDDRSSLFENPEEIIEKMTRLQQASEAYQAGDFRKVLELWPNCPSAWSTHYEMNRKQLHDLGFDYIYKEICVGAIDATGGDADAHWLAADICARYDRYDAAIQHLNEANRLRPNMPHVFGALVNYLGALGKLAKDEKAKVNFFMQARQAARILGEIAPEHKTEALTLELYYDSHVPTPWEQQAAG